MRSWLLAALAALVVGAAPRGVRAELLHVRLQVYGMNRETCAAAVRRVIGRIPGVGKVDVDLTGAVDVDLAPSKSVDLAALRRGIGDAGFESKQADVRARGTVAKEGATLRLAVTGTSMRPALAGPASTALAHAAGTVEVRGTLSAGDTVLGVPQVDEP